MPKSASVGPVTNSDRTSGKQAQRVVYTSPRKGKSFIGATAPLGAPQRIARMSPDSVHKEIHQRAPQVHKR